MVTEIFLGWKNLVAGRHLNTTNARNSHRKGLDCLQLCDRGTRRGRNSKENGSQATSHRERGALYVILKRAACVYLVGSQCPIAAIVRAG